MKKKITKYLFSACLLAGMAAMNTGCDFLDIVPDERAKEEDAFKNAQAARGFLYSCYKYMPTPNYTQGSLDLMTGDEVVTAFEHETFANFPKGNFNADNTVISYWNDLYGGIRQCYILLSKIDTVPGLEADERDMMKAEVDFLLGYYHMLLFRCYGPIIVVRELPDINTSPTDYLGRSTLDETVKFICERFDAAANSPALPASREGREVGRATKTAALALKAYTLMYYASPLFNGNSELASKVVDPAGNSLMSPDYDPQRWVNARDAYKAAIDLAHDEGHELFDHVDNLVMTNKYPENPTLRALRGNLCTAIRWNKEHIFTKAKGDDFYGIQRKSLPYISGQAWCGTSPTMSMLNRFYTKNGLPYDKDPETKNLNGFEVVTLNESNCRVKFANESEDSEGTVIAQSSGETSQMNLNREPRYYAWVAFHNGFYEFKVANTNPAFTEETGHISKDDPMFGSAIVTRFTKNDNCGRKARQGDYPPTGFLNKKGVRNDNELASNSCTVKEMPWPIIRLGELYLGYAECCAETGDVGPAKEYLNYIRERAGIPDVDVSWAVLGGVKDNKHLVEIIRQERMIEMYLENHNFWDMRRWLMAETNFNHKHTGMNIGATSFVDFSKETEVPFLRQFNKDAHYLLPIPARDINNNHNIVQNPGY